MIIINCNYLAFLGSSKKGKIETVAKFATVQTEGNRQIKRDFECYSLDVIISVGYRVKSKQGTQLRYFVAKQNNYSPFNERNEIISFLAVTNKKKINKYEHWRNTYLSKPRG